MHTLEKENDVEITAESKSEALREEFVNRLTVAIQTLTLKALYEHFEDFIGEFERIVDSKKKSIVLIRNGYVTQAETSIENIANFIDRVDSFIYDEEGEEEGEEFKKLWPQEL